MLSHTSSRFGARRLRVVVFPDGERNRVGAQAQTAARKWLLTGRQTQVLELIAQGLSSRAIAAELGCAEHTVELHVSAILSKADVDSRSALLAQLYQRP